MDNGLVPIPLHKYFGRRDSSLKIKLNFIFFRRIASNEFDKQVHVHVAMDNTLILDEIR